MDIAKVYSVTVTNTVASKFTDLDAIEVLAAPQALLIPGVGGSTLYQENNQNITYSGAGWKRGVTTLASGSNLRTTTGIGDQLLLQSVRR